MSYKEKVSGEEVEVVGQLFIDENYDGTRNAWGGEFWSVRGLGNGRHDLMTVSQHQRITEALRGEYRKEADAFIETHWRPVQHERDQLRAEVERLTQEKANWVNWSKQLDAQLAQQPQSAVAVDMGSEWTPCVKLPVVVHVRQQRDGENHVSTREGITPVKPDDLIMRGVAGEEYPIGRELFERTYTFDTTQQPQSAEAVSVAQCTNEDSWNCKYCRKTETCAALKDPRNFVTPQPSAGVVMPERKAGDYLYSHAWNNCLYEFARLNGKEVGNE